MAFVRQKGVHHLKTLLPQKNLVSVEIIFFLHQVSFDGRKKQIFKNDYEHFLMMQNGVGSQFLIIKIPYILN